MNEKNNEGACTSGGSQPISIVARGARVNRETDLSRVSCATEGVRAWSVVGQGRWGAHSWGAVVRSTHDCARAGLRRHVTRESLACIGSLLVSDDRGTKNKTSMAPPDAEGSTGTRNGGVNKRWSSVYALKPKPVSSLCKLNRPSKQHVTRVQEPVSLRALSQRFTTAMVCSDAVCMCARPPITNDGDAVCRNCLALEKTL